MPTMKTLPVLCFALLTAASVAGEPVVFNADGQIEDFYVYRQAFGEACPTAVLYFFMHRA